MINLLFAIICNKHSKTKPTHGSLLTNMHSNSRASLIFNFLNYTPQLLSHGAHLHCSNVYNCMKGQGPGCSCLWS